MPSSDDRLYEQNIELISQFVEPNFRDDLAHLRLESDLDFRKPYLLSTAIRMQRHPKWLWRLKDAIGGVSSGEYVYEICGTMLKSNAKFQLRKWKNKSSWFWSSWSMLIVLVCNAANRYLKWKYRDVPLTKLIVPEHTATWKKTSEVRNSSYDCIGIWSNEVRACVTVVIGNGTKYAWMSYERSRSVRLEPTDDELVPPVMWIERPSMVGLNWRPTCFPEMKDEIETLYLVTADFLKWSVMRHVGGCEWVDDATGDVIKGDAKYWWTPMPDGHGYRGRVKTMETSDAVL